MKLRTLHRTSAILIAAFASLHIANHLASLVGIPSHMAFMALARQLYRQPFVEGPLLFGVAFQVASGLWLIIRGWRQWQGGVAWLRALSGAVLAIFTHLGCAAYWHLQASSPRTRRLAIALPVLVGGAVSLLIVLSLAGKLQPFDVPAKYKATYAHQGR